MAQVASQQTEVLRRKGYVPTMEVAQRLGRDKKTIYYWIETGKVQGLKAGNQVYILWKSVLDFYRDQDPKAIELLGLK